MNTGDHADHVQFHKWLQPWRHILPDILFTDEAQFTPDDVTNTRNLHFWAHETL
jgi:hypothetical protein